VRTNWSYRCEAKKNVILLEVERFKKETTDAIDALKRQELAVDERYQAHLRAWDIANTAVDAMYTAKIANFENLCKATQDAMTIAAPETITLINGTTDIQTLQSMVMRLQKQLAEQAMMMQSMKSGHSPDAVVTDVTTPVVDLSCVNHDIVPGLSQEEKAARLTHADTVRSEPADSSTVSTTALAKGKGKGKTDNGGIY